MRRLQPEEWCVYTLVVLIVFLLVLLAVAESRAEATTTCDLTYRDDILVAVRCQDGPGTIGLAQRPGGPGNVRVETRMVPLSSPLAVGVERPPQIRCTLLPWYENFVSHCSPPPDNPMARIGCSRLLRWIAGCSEPEPEPTTRIPEIAFPRNPGRLGTSLPHEEYTPGLLDLEVLNYEGQDNNENERMHWALDPLLSGRIVVRMELLDGDVGDSHGGHRVELGMGSDDHYVGEFMWQAFAVWLPSDFRTPDGWTILKQNHTGSRSGKPMQTFRVEPDSDPDAITHLSFHSRTTPGGANREVAELGPAIRTRWHFFVLYLELETDASGLTRVWYSIDRPPDLAEAPAYERRAPTIDSAGYDRIGIYRQQGDSDHYPMVVYYSGYGRSATGEQAMRNAGFFEVGR